MNTGEEGKNELDVASTDTNEPADFASNREQTAATAENSAEKRRYLSRFVVALCFFVGAVSSVVSVFYIELSFYVENALQITLWQLVTIILASLGVVASFAVVRDAKFFDYLVYLFGSSSSVRTARNVEESVYEAKVDVRTPNLNETLSQINNLRTGASSAHTPLTDSKYARKIFSELKSEIEKKITQDFLESSAEKVILAIGEGQAKSVNDRIHEIQDLSLRRLGRQVEVLGVRANRNQYLGICFAVVGLLLLYASFFTEFLAPENSVEGNGSLAQFIEHYVPRLSLVILVEVVAFFFLRLYTNTLVELRYVQNEITNLEVRFLALHSALNHASDTIVSQVIGLLAATDRNAVIDKSQTTVDIEKERAASEGSVATLRAVGELLHGTEKGWFGMKR